jgi:predicted RNase H-like HicB family nuclease
MGGLFSKTQSKEDQVKSYVFSAVIEEDKFEDGKKAYHAYCPSLKGCHTWGHTQEEALTNLQEAVSLYVDDLVEAGELVPVNPEKGVYEWSSPAVVVNV